MDIHKMGGGIGYTVQKHFFFVFHILGRLHPPKLNRRTPKTLDFPPKPNAQIWNHHS
jgi:hypothetical protein